MATRDDGMLPGAARPRAAVIGRGARAHSSERIQPPSTAIDWPVM